MKKVLFTIVICSLILFCAAQALERTAEEAAQRERLELMGILLPGGTDFAEEPYSGGDGTIRAVHRSGNGFVIETATAGYAGEITMLVGVSREGTVTGLVIRDMAETPGLGAGALNDHDFLSQFLGTSGGAVVGEGIDALTGATVTSKAIARSVNSAAAFVTGADAATGATT